MTVIRPCKKPLPARATQPLSKQASSTRRILSAVASRFGFGRDLDIPLEVTPSYFPDETDAAQTALAAIGQYTVQATPLQMAMVAQGIAANGVVMRPFLVSDIVDADLQVRSTTTAKEYSNAISPEIAAQSMP